MFQAGDASPLTNTMDVEGTYESGPQGSGSVHFEMAVESHVADIHAIVQKWNSYCFVWGIIVVLSDLISFIMVTENPLPVYAGAN